MMLRSRTCARVLGAVVILVVAAARRSTDQGEPALTAGTDAARDSTSASALVAPASAEAPASSEPSAVATTAVPPTGTFSPCDDIPELESTVEGNLSGTQNPDDALTRIIRDYGDRHESFADLWINREHGGALVAAFTGDVEAHREALAALLPAGTPFDVVVADYSTAELETVRAELQANMTDIEGLSHFGMRTTRNRVEIGLVDPPDATLDRLSELVPPALVCVDVFYSPEPPSGPLDIIPLVSGDDPLVECRGIGTVRSSGLVDPLSVDEVDHPAVEALRVELRSPGPEPLPTGDWSVMHIDDDSATFAIIDGNVIAGRASFRLAGERWVLSSFGGSSRVCEARVEPPWRTSPAQRCPSTARTDRTSPRPLGLCIGASTDHSPQCDTDNSPSRRLAAESTGR